MGVVTKHDKLFNAVLETVKKNSGGLVIGEVRAALAEVEGEIAMRTNNNDFDIVCEQLNPVNESIIHGALVSA